MNYSGYLEFVPDLCRAEQALRDVRRPVGQRHQPEPGLPQRTDSVDHVRVQRKAHEAGHHMLDGRIHASVECSAVEKGSQHSLPEHVTVAGADATP